MITVTVTALGLVCDAVKISLASFIIRYKRETNIVWQKIFNLNSLLNVMLL